MASSEGSSPAERQQALQRVFQNIEMSFTQTDLGSEKWYMAAIAAIVGGNDPDIAADLYQHLARQPEFSTPPQRQRLVRRLREALFKSVIIVGVCKPLEAIMAINKCEREEDKDRSVTREGWQCDEDNLKRGMEWLQKIYTGNTESTLGLFDDHKDFAWVSKNITYGLFLSDRQVLDDLETEIVTFSSIMIQNLKLETHWHIRGMRRIGVSAKDVKVVWDAVQQVAGYLGIRLHRVPTVDEVEQDV